MEELERKERCLATVKQYFELSFDKWSSLFTEDGAKEIPYSWIPGVQMRWEGRQAVHENAVSNTYLFPKFEWYDLKIYSTQEPDVYWAETMGVGTQNTDGKETKYENHYIFCFKMRDDKILEVREFNNPLSLFVALGLEIPKMPHNAVEHTHEIFEAMQGE